MSAVVADDTEVPGPATAPPQAPLAGIFVVSDCAGYVGAYASAAEAAAVADAHPGVPFVVQRFPAAPGPADRVWVVLYRGLDAVAFVSNDRADAERVRDTFASVGLAYTDDLDYWEQPLGAATKGAAERLAAQARAYGAASASPEELAAMEAGDRARLEAYTAREDGPLARAVRENERVSILDAVVPTAARSPAAPATQLAGAQGPP